MKSDLDTGEVARLLASDVDQGQRIAELLAENERLRTFEPQYCGTCDEHHVITTPERHDGGCNRDPRAEVVRLKAENERLDAVGEDMVVDYGQLQIKLDETERELDFRRAQAMRLEEREVELLAEVEEARARSGELLKRSSKHLDEKLMLEEYYRSTAAKLQTTERILAQAHRTAAARQTALHDVNAACLLALGFVKELADKAEAYADHPTLDVCVRARIAKIRAAVAPSKPAFALAEATREVLAGALEEYRYSTNRLPFHDAVANYEAALAALEAKVEPPKPLRWEDHQNSKDLVHVDKNISQTAEGFWFWDETEAWSHGPYETVEKCREALGNYEP